MRAWLALLSEKHPGVRWMPASEEQPYDRGDQEIETAPNQTRVGAAA